MIVVCGPHDRRVLGSPERSSRLLQWAWHSLLFFFFYFWAYPKNLWFIYVDNKILTIYNSPVSRIYTKITYLYDYSRTFSNSSVQGLDCTRALHRLEPALKVNAVAPYLPVATMDILKRQNRSVNISRESWLSKNLHGVNRSGKRTIWTSGPLGKVDWLEKWAFCIGEPIGKVDKYNSDRWEIRPIGKVGRLEKWNNRESRPIIPKGNLRHNIVWSRHKNVKKNLIPIADNHENNFISNQFHYEIASRWKPCYRISLLLVTSHS